VMFVVLHSSSSHEMHLGSLFYVCQHSFTPLFFFIGLQLHATKVFTIYMVPFVYVRYYFFVFFVILKNSFVQLRVCISKTDPRWVVSSARPVPNLLSLHPCTPLHAVFPLLKSSVVEGLYFSALHHCASLTHLIRHSITAATASYMKQQLYHARINRSRTY